MQPRINVSLAEAATLTGKDKSTISKRLSHKDESKRIVGYKDDNDIWVINIASLSAHYQIPTENVNKLEQNKATPAIVNSQLDSTSRNSKINSGSTPEIIELRAEVKFLNKQVELQEEQLNDTRKTTEDLRNDRDNWKDSAKQAQETVTRQTYLLEHHREATEKPAEQQKIDLPKQPHKNPSIPFKSTLWAFMAMILAILLVLSTKSFWLPHAELFFKG